jgi:hypothetical protein
VFPSEVRGYGAEQPGQAVRHRGEGHPAQEADHASGEGTLVPSPCRTTDVKGVVARSICRHAAESNRISSVKQQEQ